MTVPAPGQPCDGERPSPLADHLKAAAGVAIDDILAEPRKVRLLTIEFELANGARVANGGPGSSAG